MQNIGLALLAVLIPLGIATLTDILQRKYAREEEFADLDLHVLLDHIIVLTFLLLCIALVFMPPILWKISLILQPIAFIPWSLGVAGAWVMGLVGNVGLVIIIFRQYKWVKGNLWDFRFSYLEHLEDQKDLEIVWRSVWEARNINTQNEESLFVIFSLRIPLMTTS